MRKLVTKTDPDYCVYILEGDDRKVYIGLTMNYSSRMHQHKNDKQKREFFGVDSTGEANFKAKKIYDKCDYDTAVEHEASLILAFRKNGYNVLNRTTGDATFFAGKRDSVRNILYNAPERGYEKIYEFIVRGGTKKEKERTDAFYDAVEIQINEDWMNSEERHSLIKYLPKYNYDYSAFMNSEEYADAYCSYMGISKEYWERAKTT